MLQAAAEQAGAVVEAYHFNDDLQALLTGLPPLLQAFDAVLLSGGVSKGKADFLPEALRAVGVQQLFHEVRQRPGKPLWFGQRPSSAVVFALPGNPVSTFINFYRYAEPWLRAVQQPQPVFSAPKHAILAADVRFRPPLAHFLLVSLESTADGRLLAHPERSQGSGDLASLLSSEAFVELPAEHEQFTAGEVLPVWQYR
jgi:molybdopterin molybdotransferase